MIIINKYLDYTIERFAQSNKKEKIRDRILMHFYQQLYFLKKNHLKFPSRESYGQGCDLLVPFFSYRIDHEHLILPVLKEISKRGVKITLIIPKKATKLAQIKSLGKNINIITFEGLFANSSLFLKARKMYIDILKEHELNYIKNSFNKVDTKKLLIKYVFDYLIAQEVIKKLNPKLVYSIQLVLNPGWLTVLKENNIKIHLIQHGFFNGEFHDFFGSDLVYLWGEYHQKKLDDIDATVVSQVVGNPKLENIKSTFHEKKIKENNHIKFLITSSAESMENLEMIKETIKILKSEENILMYKLHPSEERKKYKMWVEEHILSGNEINNEKSIYPIMENFDVVVGTSSTVVNEAAFLGKLAIRLDYNNKFNRFEDGIIKIKTLSEFKNVIKEIKNKQYFEVLLKNQNREVNKFFMNEKESPSKLIAKSIVDTLNTNI